MQSTGEPPKSGSNREPLQSSPGEGTGINTLPVPCIPLPQARDGKNTGPPCSPSPSGRRGRGMGVQDIALTLFPSPPGEGRDKRRPALHPFAPREKGPGDEGISGPGHPPPSPHLINFLAKAAPSPHFLGGRFWRTSISIVTTGRTSPDEAPARVIFRRCRARWQTARSTVPVSRNVSRPDNGQRPPPAGSVRVQRRPFCFTQRPTQHSLPAL